jgi:hypothetical protein
MPTPGSSTPRDVQFTIDTAWRTDFGDENIELYFGDGTSGSTGNFDTSTSSSKIGTFKDAAGESYTLHRHKITHTYASVTTPYTAGFHGEERIFDAQEQPGHAFWCRNNRPLEHRITLHPKSVNAGYHPNV